jgi:hypothetical protein
MKRSPAPKCPKNGYYLYRRGSLVAFPERRCNIPSFRPLDRFPRSGGFILARFSQAEKASMSRAAILNEIRQTLLQNCKLTIAGEKSLRQGWSMSLARANRSSYMDLIIKRG